MRKLTTTQENLLKELKEIYAPGSALKYDTLKILCECKSFDATFNALLEKGYVERVPSDDFSNRYKLV